MRVAERDEFAEIVGAFGEDLDLARAALLLARDAYPTLNVMAYLDTLDGLAAPIRSRLEEGADADRTIREVNHHLYEVLGFRGNREEYYDPRNSYLNEVLDRRLGIPISLSVVYIEVGQRAGLRLAGVGLPGHFLVGHPGAEGDLFIDPFNGGRLVDEAACRALVAEVYGDSVPFRREMLAPVSKRQILLRMLNNLKLVHMARQEPEAALRVIDRMLVILPESPIDIRDRGLLEYGLGRYEAARADLRRYLRASPQSPDRAAIEDALAAIETILAMYR